MARGKLSGSLLDDDAVKQRRKNAAMQKWYEKEDPELARFYRMSCADDEWPALSKKIKETRGI